MAKKYFWLKLRDNFFSDKKIKKLRSVAGGDTYTIIYLKMQLLSLKNDGFLKFENVAGTFAEEIALELDENEDNVKFVLMYLESVGLIEEVDEQNIAMLETMDNIGRESDSAKRVRAFREKQKKALQCNTSNVTSDVTNVTCNTEIEKEKEKELEKEKEKSFMSVTSDEQSKPLSVHDLIFNHYISKGLIRHKTLTAPMKTAINARLKDYSYEELIQAIDNYTIVYNGREYYFKQKYGLADLMRDKDVRKFIDEAEPLQNFLTNKKGARINAAYQQSGANQQQRSGDNFKGKFGVHLDF